MCIRGTVFERRLTLRQAVASTRWHLLVPNADVQIENDINIIQSSRAYSRIRRFGDQLYLHYHSSDLTQPTNQP